MRRLAAGVRKSAGTRRSSADTPPPDRGKGINTVSLPLATIMVMVLASSATRAAQQTVLFEGTVTGFTQITGSLATDLASLGVTVGATITGSYAYDSEAPDQISSACAGLYPTTAISFSIGSFAGAGGALILITEHHLPDCFVTPPDDAYQVTAADIPSPGSIDTITYPDYDFDFLLEDSTGTAFDSDSLPTSAPDLLNFDSQSGFIRFRSTADGLIHDVNFSIDSFGAPGPPPIPDGASVPGTPMQVSHSGSLLQLIWDVTQCPAVAVNVYIGDLGDFTTFTEGICDLPNTGSVVSSILDDSWFLVVATDGDSTDGSWSRGVSGNELSYYGASAVCPAITRHRTTQACP